MGSRAGRMGRLWGGRFAGKTDLALRRLNDSVDVDHVLLADDLAVCAAWARALADAGALTRPQADRMVRALAAMGRQWAASPPSMAGHEDVHSFVEAELARRVGSLSQRLRTGLSRNDQVATDFRLWLLRALDSARAGSLLLAGALTERAEREAATPLPGYTHMKQAEPVTFGHWCLAYVEMLLRDAERIEQTRARGDACPLGAGALSGTPVPVDRVRLARALGFSRPTANSLDAVSDRDTALEFLFCGAMVLGHMSRLAEDLILYASDEFAFVDLPDALATGSSRMPHKKNPDLLELTRGHAARAIGDLTGLLALMKGLPLAYNKDMQLDKEPCFRLATTLQRVFEPLTRLVSGLRLDTERMRALCVSPNLRATAAADRLAAGGVPFRRAHETIGRMMASGEDPVADDLDRLLAGRSVEGGTSPARVRRAARAARRRIARMERNR